MKKVIALAMTVLLLLVLTVPTFAVEANTATVLYTANQIVDPNMLMMRAELGIDERSDEAKAAFTISTCLPGQLNLAKNEDVSVTTQLIGVEVLPDGTKTEEYATTVVTRGIIGTYEDSETGSESGYSITAYATLNYKYQVDDSLGAHFMIKNTQHRVLYPSSVDVTKMDMYNEMQDEIDARFYNSRSVSSPANGMNYVLTHSASTYIPKLAATMYAVTTAHLDNGNTVQASLKIVAEEM